MPKLSPHYRNDDSAGLSPKIKNYLDKHFFGQLDNLDVPHKKLLVVFSGGNGVGKSSLAARIKQDLRAIVLENDEIKLNLLKLDPTLGRDQLNVLTWQYGMDLYARLGSATPNGLVVRDGVIDWYYDRILPVFQKQDYELFVIGYQLSESKQVELIKKRGDKPTVNVERLLSLLEDHEVHTRRFRAEYPLNATLTDDDLFEYDSVVAKIRARL